MLTQNLTQRGMHQMRCRVVQTDGITALFVDFRGDFVVHRQFAAVHTTGMADSLTVFLCVQNAELRIVARQHTGITDLAAGFRIKRGFIQDHQTFITGIQLSNRLTFFVQCNNGCRLFIVVITGEVTALVHFDETVVVRTKTAVFTGTAALFFHCRFKTGFIHFQVALTADVSGQIQRETIGVVKTECRFTAQGIPGQ